MEGTKLTPTMQLPIHQKVGCTNTIDWELLERLSMETEQREQLVEALLWRTHSSHYDNIQLYRQAPEGLPLMQQEVHSWSAESCAAGHPKPKK